MKLYLTLILICETFYLSSGNHTKRPETPNIFEQIPVSFHYITWLTNQLGMCFWPYNMVYIPGLQCYECIGSHDDLPNDCPQKECNNGVCVKGEWENFLSLIQNKINLSLGKYSQNHERQAFFFIKLNKKNDGMLSGHVLL